MHFRTHQLEINPADEAQYKELYAKWAPRVGGKQSFTDVNAEGAVTRRCFPGRHLFTADANWSSSDRVRFRRQGMPPKCICIRRNGASGQLSHLSAMSGNVSKAGTTC